MLCLSYSPIEWLIMFETTQLIIFFFMTIFINEANDGLLKYLFPTSIILIYLVQAICSLYSSQIILCCTIVLALTFKLGIYPNTG